MSGERRRDLESASWRKLRLQILRRDGWVCQLCGSDIDRRAEPCTRWAGSVDHIVSPKHGGTNDEWNLRAAHHGCNASRKQGRAMSKSSRAW